MMRKLYQLAFNRVKRYKNAKDGATAIEFALLAIPFFMLLFAILELAIIFFISSTLNHAVGESGRQIRTGNFQNCGQAAFKAAICDRMAGLGNCDAKLRVDVESNASFSTITLVDPPAPPVTPPGAPAPSVTNGVYNPNAETSAGAPVVLRALYYHKLILPAQLTRLENVPNSNTHVISATTAFRNEPFPAKACP